MNRIRLKNFKSFKDIEINLNQLTVFSGVNGAGKSTVIQALLLMIQSKDFFSKEEFEEIVLSGYYFDSSLKEIKNFDNENNIEIKLNQNNYILEDSSKNDRVKIDTPICFNNYKEFDFIAADRLGPQRNYINNLSYENRVGKYGENFAKILSKNDQIIPIVEKFLHKIFNEQYRIAATYDQNTKVAALKIGIDNGQKISPIQMPFGVSYVLPILVSLTISLIFKDKRLVIIENPEAHLHPKAQSYLGRVIVDLLKDLPDLDILIETHSEHVINGILISSKNTNFNENILINFFTNREDKKIELTINKNSEIEQAWPDDFFDQSIKDSLELMKYE